MSATSQWASANNVSCRANGIVNFTDCEYSEEGNEIEATNLGSPTNAAGMLCYEGAVDMVKTTFRGTVATDKTNQKNVQVGAKYTDFTWTDPAGQTHTGTLVIKSRKKQGMKQGLFPYTFDGFFTALVSGQ